MEKIKSVYNKKWVQWIGIPLVLFLFGYFLSLFLNPSATFSVLVLCYNKNSFIHYKTSPLLKNQMVDAAFTATEDNIGIVAVRFNTYARINDDFLIFRIKELGAKDWYYENHYKVDQFQPNELFTFGFPVVANSKGKKYYFQIISTNGSKDDSVALSDIEPIFVTKSQLSKSYILSSPKIALRYSLTRAENHIENKLYYALSLVYFLPLFLYIYMLILKYVTWNYKKYLLIAGLVGIYISFFILPNESIVLTLEFLVMWYLLVKAFNFASDVSLLVALVFFIFAPLWEIFSLEHIAESSIYWTVLFILFAAGQIVYESLAKPKKLMHYNELWHKMIKNT